MSTITIDRAVLEQALEALENLSNCYVGDHDSAGECASCHERSYRPHAPDCEKQNAITALRAALAQQEQEPVAWRVHPFDYGIGSEGVYAMTQRPDQVKAWERKGWTVQQLYIRPPRREWQGLTEEERDAAIRWAVDQEKMHFGRAVARAIEQALKEKNA